MAKVFVGLSGGIDSAVSAALLKEQGHEVTGVFIKIWQPEFIECTWREDRLDAMRVAAYLEIPFLEVDLSQEYERDVVRNMIFDYQSGITPNPDVLCNTHIKFGAFFDWAIDRGAEYVATGHYAQTKDGGLFRGRDEQKDQSYFLHGVGRTQLLKTFFPVGAFTKAEIRSRAKAFGLPNAEKPDSQGLCFVGDVSMRDFLARFIALESGAVLDQAGLRIGTHEGAALYTIGQRHGFTVQGKASGEIHFVTDVHPQSNTITVSAKREDAARCVANVRDIRWIRELPQLPHEFLVQTRYREQATPATLHVHADQLHSSFVHPHIFSAGQSLVVYHDRECLGGGIIS